MQQDSPLVLTEHPPDHPFRMQKPQKLRHMLSQHGEISRLYLAPEGANSPTRPAVALPICLPRAISGVAPAGPLCRACAAC